MERSACALLGIITYGVHMSTYQEAHTAGGDGAFGHDTGLARIMICANRRPKNLFVYNEHVELPGRREYLPQHAPFSGSDFDQEHLTPLYLNDAPIIGLLPSQKGGSPSSGIVHVPGLRNARTGFHPALDTPAKRTAAMREMCERWRNTRCFLDIIGSGKWRGDMYSVYRDPFDVYDYPAAGSDDEDNLNYVFGIERSACVLYGIVTYGVHMSTYPEVHTAGGQRSLRLWIPTRASPKSMWPGYLDNTVAGNSRW
ncbi:Thiamine pyrophosphokinase [Mycena sanguinolenta]|uniref:Thiamine pyrophosphokinase n=1 Tax=Mycena sanguinolenta TaxID=230812 RepID=A0A8H7D4Z2_9AGAR|nr:Thiamine pyrophosphokinase [Mycena sanguinolenta]